MTDHTEESVRADVRAWLEANWDPNRSLLEWRNILVDSGWGMPQWPREWFGRDMPVGFARVVDEEFKRVDALTVARKGATTLAGQTILAHGTDLLREKFLRRSLTGEDAWCQLFSEPGNGSDLAGAMTRAERRGNKYVVNGQKVWTTSAHLADYGILLARTDLDVPKHKGLSYFIIDMRQPGVEVVPLRQMNDHASFNQVFLTDAEVPPEYRLEEEGDGWRIATTTLMHERRNADSNRRKVEATPRPERIFREEAEEIATSMAPYTWYPQRSGRVDLVIERARQTGCNADPVVRQEIAKLMVLAQSAEWTAKRARAAQEQGRSPGPEGSLGKLAASEVARAANRVHTLISGADAMLTGADSPMGGVIAEVLISTPAISIAGGTDEIQKNIISERVLKMPKETRFDTDRPYREVPKNALPK
jgi:alkylation response protein AidB-like acyl-CoA dehydrogenase